MSASWFAPQEHVITVPERDMTVFTPYLGEDVMTEDELANVSDELFQTHLIRFVDPKGHVEQRLIGGKAKFSAQKDVGMGRGPTTMPEATKNANYSILIESIDDAFEKPQVNTLIITGTDMTVGDHSIWKGAPNKLYSMNLKRMANTDTTSYVLWPGPEAIQRAQLDPKQGPISFPLNGGTIRVSAAINGKVVARIHGIYCLPDPKQFTKRILRNLNPLQRDFKNKFRKGTTVMADLQNLEAVRGMDDKGRMVQLTFEVKRGSSAGGGTAKLLDIEFQVDAREVDQVAMGGTVESIDEPLIGTQIHEFRCDPTDLDHVTGLVMALEDKIASGDLSGPVIEQQYHVISAHRQALETNPEEAEVTHRINAAISGATQALWQEQQEMIGFRTQNYYYKKIKDSGGADRIASIAEDLIAKFTAARESTGIAKLTASVRKANYRKSLENLRSAAQSRLNESNIEESARASLQKTVDRINQVFQMKPE